MNLTRRVVSLYLKLDPLQIDPAARAAAQIALADGLSVMVAATALEPATAPFARHAIAIGGYGPATLIGHRSRTSAPYAALANGALAHALDFEDTFEGGMIHPNVLELAGIDASEYRGFAWGMGVERMVMLKEGIDDIRYFMSGRLDFLKLFGSWQ